MVTKSRKGAFSTKKNEEKPVEVVDPKPEEEINKKELMPETKTMVPVKEFAKPLVSVDEAREAFNRYQGLMNALMKEGDLVEIQGKKKIKKSGMNKVSKFFGISCEIIRIYKENVVGPQGGRGFVWRVWAKAMAPNGQFRVAGAACSSSERRFAHLEHDVYATAETRAKKRAIEELAGMGEYELAEENGETEEQPPARNLRRNETFTESGRIEKDLGGGVKQSGIDPNEWIPMYPKYQIRYQPAGPKLSADKKWKDLILHELEKREIDALAIKFILGRKPNVREVEMDNLTKGDAFDIFCAIKKGEFEKIISVEGERKRAPYEE